MFEEYAEWFIYNTASVAERDAVWNSLLFWIAVFTGGFAVIMPTVGRAMKSAEYGQRVVCLGHAVASVTWTGSVLLLPGGPLDVYWTQGRTRLSDVDWAAPTTHAQRLACSFSVAYFLVDFVIILFVDPQVNYILHHVISLGSMYRCMCVGMEGNIWTLSLFLLEFTNPMFNARWMLLRVHYDDRIPNQSHRKINSLLFYVAYWPLTISWLFFFLINRILLGPVQCYIYFTTCPLIPYCVFASLMCYGSYKWFYDSLTAEIARKIWW